MNSVNIALVQEPASPSKPTNLERGVALAKQAAQAGANIICFSELGFERFYPQFPATADSQLLAEPIPGPITGRFQELAKELGVVIVLNLFESAGGTTFDSSPVIDIDGSLLGVTRMIHITDYPSFHEKGYYAPGDHGAPVFDTQFGKLGVAICYDRHYPEYMRALAVAGAEIVVIPQAGSVGEWPEGLYHAELRVAAFQNGYFTALCNRVGKEDNLEFAGESFVCNPAGDVIASAGQGTHEILYADLDLDEVNASHARKLFLRDRRPNLYADWIDNPQNEADNP